MSISRVPGRISFPIVYRWKHRVIRVSRISHRRAMGGASDRRFAGGIVDRFHEGEAAAAFAAVADWLGVVCDGLEEVFEDGFMAADVGYLGGRGALVGVARGDAGEVGRGVAQAGGYDAGVLEDSGAFGAGDFEAARVAGTTGGRCQGGADGAARGSAPGDGDGVRRARA